MEEKSKKAPLAFNIAGWYGIVIAVIFLIYGGVKIVLGFLDNNFENVSELVIFAIIGIILITIAMGFRQLHKWGWYGLIVVNIIMILAAMYDIFFSQAEVRLVTENIILVIFSAIAIYSLFSPATKNYLKLSA